MARSERTAIATPALRVVELAQLDDGARRAVAGGVEIGEFDVMGPPVHAVDDGVGCALQLIVEAAIDQAADDRDIQALVSEHIAGRGPLDASLGQAAVDALDDVAAFAELAQGRLGGGVHRPLTRPELVREAETLQTPQSPDLERFEWIRLASRVRRDVDDAVLIGIPDELPVELSPALGIDLALERAADVEICARPKFLSDQILSTGAHALLM